MAARIHLRKMMTLNGVALVPVAPIDRDELVKLPTGVDLAAAITRPRSGRHHRFFMALCQLVVDNNDYYLSVDQFLTWLKVRMGHVEEVVFHNGQIWWQTKSISFEKMDQTEFREFFDRALDIILKDVLKGADKAELLAEVEMMLGYSIDEAAAQAA
jgi:hypothetical protein